jgi:NADH:ubiquinone reductase (H+-translocating)
MRPRVVIVGGGFAGLYAARVLRTAPVNVTVIDRTNHHLFQPLLYQVATAALAPSDITAPIRWLLRNHRNASVVLGEVTDIDVERRVVKVAGAADVEYDFLILGTGSHHTYFGHPEWEAIAPGLKSLNDALHIRERFLGAFERAEWATDPAERAALMTFVVVGGGPTGVELAGVMPAIAREALRTNFRHIDTAETRVILVEGGNRLLPTFPEHLSARAKRDLEQIGVDVRLSSLVSRITGTEVHIGAERIESRTVFWAAGNEASHLGRALHVPLDRAGRVIVEPDLSIPGHPEVFVAGDLAVFTHGSRRVPGVCPAAMQEGQHAARMIIRTLRRQDRKPFRYVNKGDLATIGRSRAIADFGSFTVAGSLAWWFWLFLHILYLAGFRNRLSVLLQWGYAYLTFERGVRLITSTATNPAPAGTKKG